MEEMNREPEKVEQGSESLDPLDWESMKSLLHIMVDDAIDYVANVRDRKIWQEMPDHVQAYFDTTLPERPSDITQVYRELKEKILPYPMGNIHPRFWAWYMGSGTITGAIGDFWASIMNPNLGGGNHAPHKVEEQIISWMIDMIQFPKSASGLLVSGGSMANFTGLLVARNAKAGYDVRTEGLKDNVANRMRVYSSTEVHSSNQKALEIMGLGAKSLCKIPVLDDYTIDVTRLQEQICKDKVAGLLPFCIIGTAGTINTGAIDDLNALADICEREDLWLHVDGAIGAVAVLSDRVKRPLRGMEKADSVALDLHKWMHMPFEAGCIIVKHQDAHKNTFSLIPEYLAKNTRGVASGENWFSEYGLQLSRRFRALKVWMSLKEHGTIRFGDMISKNIDQAQYLGRLIRANAKLELLAPIGLDIVCFRYNPGKLKDELLNDLNKEIKLQLEEEAIAVPGYTTLGDVYCIRIAIANHRTTLQDLNELIFHVVRLGDNLIRAQA